jgi:hypothetical protein
LDPLRRIAASSPAGLRGGGRLPPLSSSSPVLQLGLVVADLLPLLPDLLPLHRRLFFFFFSVLRTSKSPTSTLRWNRPHSLTLAMLGFCLSLGFRCACGNDECHGYFHYVFACLEFIEVDDVDVSVKAGSLEQINVYAHVFSLFYVLLRSMMNMSNALEAFFLCSRATFCCGMLTHACSGQPRCTRTEFCLWMLNACRWIPLHTVSSWPNKLQPWLWWCFLFFITRLRRIRPLACR